MVFPHPVSLGCVLVLPRVHSGAYNSPLKKVVFPSSWAVLTDLSSWSFVFTPPFPGCHKALPPGVPTVWFTTVFPPCFSCGPPLLYPPWVPRCVFPSCFLLLFACVRSPWSLGFTWSFLSVSQVGRPWYPVCSLQNSLFPSLRRVCVSTGGSPVSLVSLVTRVPRFPEHPGSMSPLCCQIPFGFLAFFQEELARTPVSMTSLKNPSLAKK